MWLQDWCAYIIACNERLRTEIISHPDIAIGLDAPDDAAVVKGIGRSKSAVHTVDFFDHL